MPDKDLTEEEKERRNLQACINLVGDEYGKIFHEEICYTEDIWAHMVDYEDDPKKKWMQLEEAFYFLYDYWKEIGNNESPYVEIERILLEKQEATPCYDPMLLLFMLSIVGGKPGAIAYKRFLALHLSQEDREDYLSHHPGINEDIEQLKKEGLI